MDSGEWSVLNSQIAPGYELEVEDTFANEGQRFYRAFAR